MVTFLHRYSRQPAPTIGSGRFADVPRGSFYDAAVRWADAAGVTTGCAPNRFCPHEATTRAQALTLIWRFVGQPR